MFEFTDKKSAVALVKYERDRSKVVYADYIAANGVTLDNVSEHVAALQALAFPDFDPKTADDESKYVRKTFGNRVRNGLNFTLGKRPEAKDERAETASTEEAAPENDVPEDAITVPATPAQALAIALQTAQAAGMTRADILAVVADVVDVSVAA